MLLADSLHCVCHVCVCVCVCMRVCGRMCVRTLVCLHFLGEPAPAVVPGYHANFQFPLAAP